VTASPAMLAVQTLTRGAKRFRPRIRQVAATISMATANRAPLPDCVPKLPLRHWTVGRMPRSATLSVGSTPETSRYV